MVSSRRILCTAGVNNFVMTPNGDVYRCMVDFMDRQPPMFNARNGWFPLEKPAVCTSDRCEAECDLDWTTKWIFETGKTTPTVCQARCGERQPHFSHQRIDTALSDVAHIVWMPTLRCNYDCRYCCVGSLRGIRKGLDEFSDSELSKEEWFEIWNLLYERYRYAVVALSGGEPLITEAAVPIMAFIADKFLIELVTNLSLSTHVMRIVRAGIKPGTATGMSFISGSLHPTARQFNKDAFFGALLYLKAHGFNVSVNFVGYPPQLFLAPDYKRWCEDHGVSFSLLRWGGWDNDGFEARYTEEEERFMGSISKPGTPPGGHGLEFEKYDYVMTGPPSSFRVQAGERIALRGTLVNKCSFSWTAMCSQDSPTLKIGAKVVRYGDERVALSEARGSCEKDQVSPGESVPFEVSISTERIPKGIYLLKIDLLEEGKSWLESKGVKAARLRLEILAYPFHSEVKEVILPGEINRGSSIGARIVVKNAGAQGWCQEGAGEAIRVGCRAYRSRDEVGGMTLREFRGWLPAAVQSMESIELDMQLDFSGFEAGSYVLVFDMVKEGEFWFECKGSKVLMTDVRVG